MHSSAVQLVSRRQGGVYPRPAFRGWGHMAHRWAEQHQELICLRTFLGSKASVGGVLRSTTFSLGLSFVAQTGERRVSRQKEKALLTGWEWGIAHSLSTHHIRKEQATDGRVAMGMFTSCAQHKPSVSPTRSELEPKRGPFQTLPRLQSGRSNGDAG